MMTNKNNSKELLYGFIILLWVLAVTMAYLVSHKPFTPEQFLGLLLTLWRLIFPASLITLAGAIGLLFHVEQHNLPRLTTAALSTGLGLGLLALYTLAWGAWIGINGWIYILPLASLILMRKQVKAWLRLWTSESNYWNASTWIGKFILIAGVLLLLCQLAVALAPPLQFDTLTYHFAIPQAYIQTGKIHYLPNLMFWGMPQQTEMIYLLAMLAGGAEAAAVSGWMIGLLALMGLADFARQHYGADSALVAVAGLMSGQTLISALGSGYVEWASILYGLSMFAILLKWLERRTHHQLILAGIFAGLALATKYTSGIALLTGLAVIATAHKPNRITLASLLIFGSAATLVFSPWLFKNFLGTGNPLYPLIFATRDFDAVRMGFYNFAPLTQDWSRLVLLPWQATIFGVENGAGYSASIGALLLAFSPLAWILWNKLEAGQRTLVKTATVIVALTFMIWGLGSQFRGLLIQSRLYVASFPAWALLAATGFAALTQIKTANIRFGNIASALAALALTFVVYETVLTTTAHGATNVALGIRTPERYLENNLGDYQSAITAIKALPAQARVLMLWETRGFYCEPICDSDEIIDRWYHDWHTINNVDRLIGAWRAQGYTHLLLRVDGMNFVKTEDKVAPFTPADWQALDELLTRLKVVDRFGESYVLYTLEK